MPGIVGLITKMPYAWAESRVETMVDAVRHESFYQTGTWADRSLGVYVGWSALPSSFSGKMPVYNERRDIALLFSGEEYSEQDATRRLKERGHSINAPGASYLVHMYEEDPAFLATLNGMFHGILIDQSRREAILFNDRYGMHRIYFHESKEAFYFAVEPKAILAACPQLRRADARSLGEFVALSCVLEDRTLFQGITAVPAASAWTFCDGSIDQKNTYFRPAEWEDQTPLDPEAYYHQLREVWSHNLPAYFKGDQQIGVALTGGMDTRVIMAWQKSAARSMPCYTFGGPYRDSQDVILAQRVAEECQQSYQVITVGDEFLSKFPYYAERSIYLTEGSIDVYRSSDLYVSEKARTIAPVKVVGTYGSEIVRHAVMFKPMAPAEGLFRPELLSSVQQAGDTYVGLRREHPVTFAAFRQSPWYHHGILALEQSQLTVRSPYLDNDFVRTVFRAPQSFASNGDVRLRLIADGSPALTQIPSDRGIGGNSGRFSSALSHRFLEFTFKAEYGYDYGMPQWVACVDHLLSPFRLERLFLGRHKFLHYRVWYRDRLSQYVRQMLLDPLTLSRPYLNRKVVEKVVIGHLKGNRNYTTAIHKLLTLELLHRRFFDTR